MATNLYVGDAIALVKIAYDLYEKGYLVARHAPDELRDLLEDLDLLKEILWGIQARLQRDGSSQDHLTERLLSRCKQALLDFEPFLQKYQNLAETDHGLWVKRITWAKDQKEIRKLQENFQQATSRLQLLLVPALRECPGYHEPVSPATQVLPMQNRLSRATLSPQPGHAIPRVPVPARYSNELQSKHIVEMPAAVPAELSAHSEEEFESLDRYLSATQQRSNISPAAELSIGNEASSSLWYPSPTFTTSSGSTRVDSAISFTREYHEDLQWDDKREKHDLGRTVLFNFQSSAKSMARSMDVDRWLCHAAWWLIKSKVVWNCLTDDQGRLLIASDDLSSWPVTVSIEQASADLYKSSFIIENIVLPLREFRNDSNLKNLKSLSDMIDHDLAKRRKSRAQLIKDQQILLKQSLELREIWLSPIESPERVPRNFDNVESPQRWLCADESDCGLDQERVMYRTFVNAQLGPKTVSMKSNNAPYLLVLSCKKGRSDIHLSLCNLTFTVNLSRIMTWDDLYRLQESTRPDGGLIFDFPNQQAILRFLSRADHEKFLGYLRPFFEALRDRGPRPHEVLALRTGLQSYQSKDAAANGHLASNLRMNERSAECELSLYDHCPEESWKTTRRIVISSDGTTLRPWTTSYWLPLSRVQVQAQSREVLLVWSDYQQLHERSNGEYGTFVSRIYDPDHPNCSVSLIFENEAAAKAFVGCLLRPFTTPFKLQFVQHLGLFKAGTTTTTTTNLYRLRDLNEQSKGGRYAIVRTSRKPNYLQMTDVFFVHRDVDFELRKDNGYRIDFRELSVPDYISTIRDVAKKPEDEYEEPQLADVGMAYAPARFNFVSEDQQLLFMTHLLGWKLNSYQRVRSINLNRTLALSMSYTDVVVHVIEKRQTPNEVRQVRVVLRMTKDDEPYWITTLPTQPYLHGSKVILKGAKISTGDEIDSKTMEAIDSSTRSQQSSAGERVFTLTIIFEHSDHARDFTKYTKTLIEDWQTVRHIGASNLQ